MNRGLYPRHGIFTERGRDGGGMTANYCTFSSKCLGLYLLKSFVEKFFPRTTVRYGCASSGEGTVC